MEVRRFGLDADNIAGILYPLIDPEMPLLETDIARAVLSKVSDAIYFNNEQITKDLAKAGVFIPD